MPTDLFFYYLYGMNYIYNNQKEVSMIFEIISFTPIEDNLSKLVVLVDCGDCGTGCGGSGSTCGECNSSGCGGGDEVALQ